MILNLIYFLYFRDSIAVPTAIMKHTRPEPNRFAFLAGAVFKTILALTAVGVVVVVLFGWFQDATKMIYHMRVPILASAILLFLGILVARNNGIRQLLGNLFVLAGPIQLASVIVAAFIYANAILLTFNIIWQAGPTRFGFEQPAMISWFYHMTDGMPILSDYAFYLYSLLLSLPILIITVRRTRKELVQNDQTSDEAPPPFWITRGSLWGIALVVFISILSNRTETFISDLFGVNATSDFLLTNPVVSQCNCWAGYTGPFTELHFSAMAFLMVGVVIYLIVGNLYHPNPPLLARIIQGAFRRFLDVLARGRWLFRGKQNAVALKENSRGILGKIEAKKSKPVTFHAAALFYVLILLTSLTLFLGSLTFLYDYIMVPIVLVLAGFSFLMSHISGTKNEFPVAFKAPYAAMDDEAFCEVLKNRLAKQEGDRTLVIVCLKGGGIHSAGWGVRVLTGLHEVMGASFGKAIGIVSGVSGGAVGVMHYVNHVAERKAQRGGPLSVDRVFREATADSLDAAAWGILYLDFWRFIGLPFLILRDRDRGWAIEEDWKLVMGEREIPTLEAAKERAEKGDIPIPIMNATVEADGTPLFFSPVKIPICNSPANAERYNFVSLLTNPTDPQQHPDLDMATAARLSAAFPYVSPISCNNCGEPENVYLADGGYFDNYAMFSAVNIIEWLQLPHKTASGEYILAEDGETRVTNAEKIDLKNVLLISVRAFPVEETESSGSNWLKSVLGPLNIVMAARSSTQGEHMQKEVDLLEKLVKRSGHAINIETVNIEYPGSVVDPPLSWKLSPKEKLSIKEAWKTYVDEACWEAYCEENEDPAEMKNPVTRIKEIWARWKQ